MIEKYLSIAFILIVIYLILANRDGFDSAIRGIGGLNIASIGALQGRSVNAFGVNLGSGNGTGAGGYQLPSTGFGPYGGRL